MKTIRSNLEKAGSAVGTAIDWTLDRVCSVLTAAWDANERSLTKERDDIRERTGAIASKVLEGGSLSLRDRFDLGNSKLAGEYFAELVVREHRGELNESKVQPGATVTVVELPEELQGHFKGNHQRGVRLEGAADTSFMGDYHTLQPGQSLVLSEVKAARTGITFLAVQIEDKWYGLTKEEWIKAYYSGQVTF
jgi:hypothetical protein